MKISVLAIQLVFLLCYIELQEVYGDKIKNCLKNDDNDKCMCCESGYRGPTCDINCKQCSSRILLGKCSYSCKNGYYGDKCNKTCPTTCANGVSGVHFCTETNGTIECGNGCIKGYTGKQCSNCIDSHYHGDHCNITCSKECKSETCNRTGHCTHGCVDGFYGGGCNSHCGSNCIEGKCTQDINSSYICTKGCVDGNMGSNCSKMCPVQCATCEQRSGRCMSCVGNYVYMPETGECENQPDNLIWIIMGLVISLVILGVISVIVIVRLKKKRDWSGYSMVCTNAKDMEDKKADASGRVPAPEEDEKADASGGVPAPEEEKKAEACGGVPAPEEDDLEKKRKVDDKDKMNFKWNINVQYRWNIEEVDELRTNILELGKKYKLKLLLFGLTGHGKSSLGNGFRSALLNTKHVSRYHQTRLSGAVLGSSTTFTKGFCASDYGEDFWIIDMGGIYESRAFTNEAIENILSGKVPIYAKLTEHLEAMEMASNQIQLGKMQELSCIIIVLMPGIDFGEEVTRQLRIVDDLAGKGVISRHLVLTHLDKIDETFMDPHQLPRLFDSPNVQSAVLELSRTTGIDAASTSVVRNYVNETETNVYSNLLLLKTLHDIVNNAVENIERKNTDAYIKEKMMMEDTIPETSN